VDRRAAERWEAVMLFLILPAVLVLVIVHWIRLSALERQLSELAARLRLLEGQPFPVKQEPIIEAPRVPPAPVAERRADSAPNAMTKPEPAEVVKHQPVAAADPTPAAALLSRWVVTPADNGHSLESRIGGRWLLYVGVLTIVIGVAYFEKLAIDNHWINETARTIEATIAGLALVWGGARLAHHGYRLYGQMLTGCGLAILYVATYAAVNFYDLIGRSTALAVLLAITALAASLADRAPSQGLALIAVGGGFATPFLVPSRTDAQYALFTYDAILIAGTMYLAHRRSWPALNVVSYAFTIFTVAAWFDAHYAGSKYLSTELFLTLFCAMYLYVLRESRRARTPRWSEGVLWTAPVLYYVASIAILADHSVALLVYLIALALAGVIAASRFGSIARLLFWMVVAAPLMAWAADHAGRTWLVAGVTATVAIYVIQLMAQLETMMRGEHDAGVADIVLLHANGLWTYGTVYLLIERVSVPATWIVAALFAAWNGSLAFRLVQQRRRQLALHYAAVGFTLLTVAIALAFDGPWVTFGWAAEGAAVIALGLRERREWLRAGGVLLFAVAVARLLALQFAEPPIDQIPLVNRRVVCGGFIIGLTYFLAWLHNRRGDRPQRPREVAMAIVAAQALTLTLFSSEIVAYWNIHEAARDSLLARGLMLSMTWAIFATVLIVAGMRRRYAPLRYFAIALFAVTIAKVFAIDLAELDRIYRISSIVGLGIALLVSSYLYQRFEKEFNR